MKILSIGLCNLNSLTDSWSIDLTAPAFAASGIFAITGPTGAGKSTILDAICLALFARTPRLGHISKGSNEIMSRQAGHCFAEVAFETAQGRYRCHWGQHRARRSPHGALQTPRHEMVDAITNTVLESRSKEVCQLVEQVSGMDYDRFTRSMLLAQGDFAAFLQAEADQRAPILEQITGTSIYSRISIAVHERASEERRKAALLAEAMGEVHLLSTTEEQDLIAVIKESAATAVLVQQRVMALSQALGRLDLIENLRTQLTETHQLVDELTRRRQAASEELRRLERGQCAQGLVADYSCFAQVQEQIVLQRTNIAGLCARLEQMQSQQHQGVQNHAQAVQARQKAVALREQENELIKAVREMDLRLHEKKQAMSRHTGQHQQAEREWAQASDQHRHLMAQLVALRAQEKDLIALLHDQASDGLLVEHLAGFRQQLQQLAIWEQGLIALDEACKAQQIHHTEAVFHEKTVERVEADLSQKVTAQRQRQQALEEERSSCLAGQEPAFWRHEVEVIQQHLQEQEQAQQLLGQYKAMEQELTAFRQRVHEAEARQRQQTEALRDQSEQYALHQQSLSQLEQNQALHQRICSQEEERQRLQPGSACPLCGSRHHPWVESKPQLLSQEEPITRARAELSQRLSAITQIREHLAALARDIEHGQQGIEKRQHQQAALAEQLGERLAEQQLGEDLGELRLPGIQQLALSRAQLLDARQRVQHLDRLEEELRQARAQTEQDIDQHTEIRQQLQTARHQSDNYTKELERLDRQAQEEEARIRVCRDELICHLEPLGINHCPPGQGAALLAQLEARRKAWKEHQQRLEDLVFARNQVQTAVDTQELLLDGIAKTRAQQEAELAVLGEEARALLAARHDCYGDRDPNVCEQQANRRVQQAEAQEEQTRTLLAAIDKEIYALNQQLRLGEEALEQLLPQSQRQETALLAQVLAAGFTSLDDFNQALLPAKTLAELAARWHSLETEQAALAARRAEQMAALARAQEEAGEQHNREALHAEHKAHNEELANLQQGIGATQERLTVNKDNRQHFEAQHQALSCQTKELERWELLHHLIGSADGKKFRVFAQGLTFEVMISHANRQLRTMSDRYILRRDPKEPLALQVLDNYQAGEIRSTRNLSGGESFLVSLALSLGLSAMASHNVRVDSLFLDEGFGTLDEDALESALHTLAALRQVGKLIGVISHVPLLRDRIDLRIQVLPGAGGCSRLLGPGCSRDA